MPVLNTPDFVSDETAIRQLFPVGHPQKFPALYLWEMTESPEELARMLPTGKGETGEAEERCKALSRRKERLATKLLLHLALGKDATIGHLSSGKPYLPGSELEISISHTKGYAAIALHTAPIGIDIELRAPRALSLSSKFLKEEEMRLLEAGEKPEDEAVRLWCAKEAAYKLFGLDKCGLQESITLSELPKGVLACTPHAPQQATVRFATHEDFVFALALPKEDFCGHSGLPNREIFAD